MDADTLLSLFVLLSLSCCQASGLDMKYVHWSEFEKLTNGARVPGHRLVFHMDSSQHVLRRLFASESLKRTYRPGNCARMA